MERILIALVALVSFCVQGVQSQTDQQRRACVVVSLLENGVVAGYGTGTLIEHNGRRLILSCAHVARGMDDVGVIDATPAEACQIRYMGGVCKAVEVAADADADIAVLTADELPEDLVPFRVATTPAKIGEGLRLLTRGGMSAERSHCRFKSAVIGPGSDEYHAFVACLVQSGDSGAAYLNDAGEVVGLQSSGMPRNEFGNGESKRYWPSYGPSLEPILAVLESVK